MFKMSLFLPAFLAVALGSCAEDVDTTSCPSENADASKGSVMLQVRHATSAEKVVCSIERAKQEPLTEEGFNNVVQSCCFEDVKTFVSRLVDSRGLKVCDEGGLSGIAPFYSCPTTPVTFAELNEELAKATEEAGKVNSKCHWLAARYEECTEPSLECAISVQRPAPAPQAVASGFLAFKVANPAMMVRSSKAIDITRNELSLSLGIDVEYINVIIASGALNGEEVVSSFVGVPPSQFFFQGATKICKVYAVYSIQEPAPKNDHLTTPAPSLNEEDIVAKLQQLDTETLSRRLTQDIEVVDGKNAGEVECMETSTCEKTSGKCTHQTIKEVSE